MVKRRENLNLEERLDTLGCPTRYETEHNRHGLRCRECSELYYVDDSTSEKVSAVIGIDPTESPFVCSDCEAAYAEEASVR